ncbi:hypothetical protein N0M98_19460 [Paenibacillus doosanensis]|uniref:hypothetical protein n=1 Tax=Paenibacillus doosanensis TaxID=1229154 RepID=UPI00217F8643|nr:hypothetical protein [Paenibacillus doosanensis]MCS7462322.1 hypothetical protein [Paenibacillus doosanensis]
MQLGTCWKVCSAVVLLVSLFGCAPKGAGGGDAPLMRTVIDAKGRVEIPLQRMRG